MATINRVGFGQVEPNHLSAQRNGQVYAQLPANEDIEILENGQFVKYDYANMEVNFEGKGEWMMVFNEVKLYDGWRETYKDFAMIKANYTPGTGKDDGITHEGYGKFHYNEELKYYNGFPGTMYPRVIKTMPGDIFTTNCLEAAGEKRVKFEGSEDITVGTILTPGETGYLTTAGAEDADMQWQVVKVYTMPDGQDGVKVMRIK